MAPSKVECKMGDVVWNFASMVRQFLKVWLVFNKVTETSVKRRLREIKKQN